MLTLVTHHTHDLTDRLARAQKAAAEAGMDALLVSPGADLRYLTGYEALPLERLTCLVLPAVGDPLMVVPALEKPAAEASPLGRLDLEILPWNETDDPYALIASRLPGAGTRAGAAGIRVVGLDNHMWAEKVLNFRRVLPEAEQTLAGAVLSDLRVRKTPEEIASLRAAGAAIDAVHRRVHEWLRPGRTEREVGQDIADAILAAGHASVDFVIVGSGPNGASPHHELSDRVIQAGDQVVVDIGGTMPDGYCSDSTRNYSLGAPSAEYAEYFAVLLAAQQAQCDAIRPGITAEELDGVGRDLITAAGFGDKFIHRTGH
ncbi:MAG: aminopeptidase P family protein, partial [Catenulispora sp.]|nr:aminopeptidase P family protein [Catenulispora sp.]